MKKKEEVKDEIIFYCKKYNLTPPTDWTYKEVKRISKVINSKKDDEEWERELNNLQDNEWLWKE